MSDEQSVDVLAGLHAVEAVLGAIRVDVNAIGPAQTVGLAALRWALDKLADDLHKADVEIRNARLEVASARREADTAQQQQQAEQLQSLSIFNGLRHELETVKAERDAARAQLAELIKKPAELPAQPAPEPCQWQVGDLIFCKPNVKRVVDISNGWVFLQGCECGLPQREWEDRGYMLLRDALAQIKPRRASLDGNLPDIPRFTEQQMADFKAVMEQVSDSVGADGEGQP
jgi:hypothetical protein